MDNFDKIRNASISAQVIIKEASNLVIAGKYDSLDKATDALFANFDRVFGLLTEEKKEAPKPKKEVTKPVEKEVAKIEVKDEPAEVPKSALYAKAITALEQCTNQAQAEELIGKFRTGTKLSSQEKAELLDAAEEMKNKLPF